jgi:mercuric ion transport protein
MAEEQTPGRAALLLSGLAALLASSCCLGPLLLVMLGFSGAWISNLSLLEPYRPFFIGVALVAMAIAYWRIFRFKRQCQSGEVCAVPQVKWAYQALFWVVVTLVVIALSYPYLLPWFY